MSVAEAVGASWAESCWPRALKAESTDTPGGEIEGLPEKEYQETALRKW